MNRARFCSLTPPCGCQAAPGTEVSALGLALVGGKSVGSGKKERVKRESSKETFQRILAGVYSPGDWENCPRGGVVHCASSPNSQYERIRSSPGDKTEEDCSGLHRRLRVVAPRSQAKIHALNILWKTKQRLRGSVIYPMSQACK